MRRSITKINLPPLEAAAVATAFSEADINTVK